MNSRVTLADMVFPRAGVMRDAVLVISFSILTALCARISLWIGPVPITGQTFGVLLAGAFLGSHRGALSQLTYVAVGATGIPFWFAPGGAPGIARLMGPTGGYLLGFVAMAFVVGWLAERGWDRRAATAALAMLAGSAAMYIFGLSWLAHFFPETVLKVGLYPFIPGDLLKIALAVLVVSGGWRLLDYRGT